LLHYSSDESDDDNEAWRMNSIRALFINKLLNYYNEVVAVVAADDPDNVNAVFDHNVAGVDDDDDKNTGDEASYLDTEPTVPKASTVPKVSKKRGPRGPYKKNLNNKRIHHLF
jgi:hypothetical protein